mmetsp:Transcript_106618/g.301669  ORF Transcript_106618/g.301669 Transcript_106618/m.301669 type:complete len:261 (-) Transcript_106618:28-810(-)
MGPWSTGLPGGGVCARPPSTARSAHPNMPSRARNAKFRAEPSLLSRISLYSVSTAEGSARRRTSSSAAARSSCGGCSAVGRDDIALDTPRAAARMRSRAVTSAPSARCCTLPCCTNSTVGTDLMCCCATTRGDVSTSTAAQSSPAPSPSATTHSASLDSTARLLVDQRTPKWSRKGWPPRTSWSTSPSPTTRSWPAAAGGEPRTSGVPARVLRPRPPWAAARDVGLLCHTSKTLGTAAARPRQAAKNAISGPTSGVHQRR